MHTLKHLLINISLGILILFVLNERIFSINLLLIILAGVLIDIDHVFNEIYKGTIKNPRKVIRYWASTQDKHVKELYLFHSYEFLFILLVLSFIFMPLIYILIGLIIHFITDGITNYNDIKSFSWLKHYSVIWWLIRKKD